jgi:hypothetical protein
MPSAHAADLIPPLTHWSVVFHSTPGFIDRHKSRNREQLMIPAD